MTRTTPYVPDLDGLHGDFFRLAATTGRLHLQRCDECLTFRHPPRYYCPGCFSPAWTFVPVGGGGHVYSKVVVHRPFGPAPTGDLPYATVVVELDEGPRILGIGRGAPPAEFTLDRHVRIEVEPSGEEFAHFGVVLDDG